MDPEQLLTHGYRYALSLTGDVPAAEDLLQDAWTSVLAAQGPMDRAYLFRTIRNRWIDGHRRGRLVVLDPDGGPEVPVRPEAERLIEADALWEGLLALREEEREALYLHHVEGWSAQEVGERTGRPRNTVLPQRAPAGWSVVRVHPDAVAPLVEGRRTTSFERGPHFEGRNLDLAGLPARDRGHRGYVDVWTVDGPAPTRLVRGYSDGERVRVPPEEVDAVRAALDGQTARLVRVFPGTEQVWWLALQAPVPPGASEVSVGVADVEVVRGRIVDGGMLRVVDPTVIGALLRADSRGLLTLRRL